MKIGGTYYLNPDYMSEFAATGAMELCGYTLSRLVHDGLYIDGKNIYIEDDEVRLQTKGAIDFITLVLIPKEQHLFLEEPYENTTP